MGRKDDEEIAIDFSKIKSFFTAKSKKKGKPVKTPNAWVIAVALLLIPIILSIFFRIQPVYLPITDQWAEDSVNNYYQNMIMQDMDQQFPNLPEADKKAEASRRYQEFLQQNSGQVQTQIEQTSNFFKDGLKDENGHTYLLAIDPYFWYALARNYVRDPSTGLGDTLNEEGDPWFSLRNGRFGKKIGGNPFNSYAGVYLYKFLHVFNKDITVMRAMFFLPLIIVTLAVIPAFFIGRKVAGNVGGLFAGTIVAINSALLGRTPAGFSDTDAYNILFPLLALWLFIESLDAKDLKRSVLYSGLAGFVIGLYSTAWGGWWFVFDFIMAAMGLNLIALAVLNWKTLSKSVKGFFKLGDVKSFITGTAAFGFASMLFVTLLRDFDAFLITINGPLNIIQLKEVAVKSLWPNVLTTVAEFNEIAIGKIAGQMGGNILFFIGIVGVVWAFFRKDMKGRRDLKFAFILLIWIVGTAYGFTKGVRFAILMVPGFAIAFGICVGYIYNSVSRWINRDLNLNKTIASVVVILLLAALLVSPLKAAYRTSMNEVPSMDDAWYNSLKKIGEESEEAIITSWWDFGHWFYSISERSVTFDGGDQGERIHWVGRSLLENNESQAVGIIRQLNCGQERAPHILEEKLADGEVRRRDTVDAIEALEKMAVVDREGAEEILKEYGVEGTDAMDVLQYTHCEDLIDNYYITSADMIGKSGVWAHFGSWDFRRAAMYQDVKRMNEAEGTQLLQDKYGLSEEQASIYYYEIINTKADDWIAPWPSYASGLSSCTVNEEGIAVCGNGIRFDVMKKDAFVNANGETMRPKTVVWAEIDGLHKKEYNLNLLEGNQGRNISVAIIPAGQVDEDGVGSRYQSILMDTALDEATFTRLFFYKGHGSRHFDLFREDRGVTGVDILVWNVSWEPGEQIIMEEFIGPDEVRASHILVNSSEEAEEVKSLLEQGADFADLAQERSIGPTSEQGGDLGWFSQGKMVPAFDEAVFSLEEVGDISDVVQSDFGYHVIKLTGKRDGEEHARELLEQRLSPPVRFTDSQVSS